MRIALALAALLLAGCPDKKPSVDENDPLIKKLKAEQDRLERGGQPGGPPGLQLPKEPQPLAEIAQQVPDVPVNVPVKAEAVTVNEATFTPRRLESAQIVAGPKTKLSTTDRFLRLVLSVQTTKELTFDLSKAQLVRGTDAFELARDVQRVGQGSPLAPTVGPGVSQDLVLYFEVAPAAITPGLSLQLPVSDATATVPLL